jgi:hypothetical protein
VGEICKEMGTLLDKMDDLHSSLTSADAETEIKELKSALNHVAMLAKCAHEATVDERKHHTAEIALLNQKLAEKN